VVSVLRFKRRLNSASEMREDGGIQGMSKVYGRGGLLWKVSDRRRLMIALPKLKGRDSRTAVRDIHRAGAMVDMVSYEEVVKMATHDARYLLRMHPDAGRFILALVRAGIDAKERPDRTDEWKKWLWAMHSRANWKGDPVDMDAAEIVSKWNDGTDMDLTRILMEERLKGWQGR
jgi:hypothetical protein